MKFRAVFSVFVFVFLLVNFQPLKAQRVQVQNLPTYDYAKYHFGFILAINQMHFAIKPAPGLNYAIFDSQAAREINADSARIFSVEHSPTYGFTVGIVSNLRMGKYFDLRFVPSLAFGERNIEYRFMKYRDGQQELIEITKNTPSTFVELPFHLKYKSKRVGNYRAYLLTGVNYRIDLASQANKKQDAAEIQVKLFRYDVAGELGVGFDFYFEWFKFGTELKMSYGVFDMLKHEDNIYTEGIDVLRSKVFQVSLTFE